MKHFFAYIIVLFLALSASAQQQAQWIDIPREARPYTRWWWLGSAVDLEGLRYNLSEYAKAGIGGVEITPIYGVKGNDANNISYLSPEWMRMLNATQQIAHELDIDVEMATGTGWPFGGPLVPESEAAAKLKVENGKLITDRTRQKVKRAAPGGEGLVIDHFDRQSVVNYLSRFDKAFSDSKTPFPPTFFNDSYEVYNADWTPRMLEEFKARRGYALEDHVDEFLGTSSSSKDIQQRIMSDYRETLSELLLENFTTVWTDWAHSHNAQTRNQAHGSPANLIDIYAAVDIPECEGFGLSDFGIKGLRTDVGFTKKNDSDLSMLKYASSAAHISGKKLTSSETFTWLTEHFRTSFAQCKPDFDLMMIAGVNHMVFHGSCYSPADDPWPGWRFYASIDMTPANNLWRDAPAFCRYIERVQAFMQYGVPDNDVLVYLPFYDMIHDLPGRLLQFDIHGMAERAPKFISSINALTKAGYDCDYISDRYLMQTKVADGNHERGMANSAVRQLTTTGSNRYAAILVPDVKIMPLKTLKQLLSLARQGATVIFVGDMPKYAPGLKGIDQQEEFDAVAGELKTKCRVVGDYASLNADIIPAQPELMRTQQGLSCIRRAHGNDHFYFVSNLQGKDVDEWITLGKSAQAAIFYDPMTGKVTKAQLRNNASTSTNNANATTQLRLQLRSGESMIIYLSDKDTMPLTPHRYLAQNPTETIELTSWTLHFLRSEPQKITKTYRMLQPTSWTELGDEALTETMATGLYSASFTLKNKPDTATETMMLDLGDVRETARVSINGKEVATLFAVPYQTDVTEFLKRGKNTIEVEVSNLAANRISKMDRDGVEWRKFNEINVVDLNYKNTLYSDWQPVPSGLCGKVMLKIYR